MKIKYISERSVYTGEQLASLQGYLKHGLLGDSIVAWRGACRVDFAHMVDGEDLRASARIQGDDMLHFVAEIFHQPLFTGVCLQRLLASLALDLLREKVDQEVASQLRREGDDLFFSEGKLSISIATASPVSTLIHFAINCTNEGTPEEVETAALDEMDIEPEAFAQQLMSRFANEFNTIREATVKVRWVR